MKSLESIRTTSGALRDRTERNLVPKTSLALAQFETLSASVRLHARFRAQGRYPSSYPAEDAEAGMIKMATRILRAPAEEVREVSDTLTRLTTSTNEKEKKLGDALDHLFYQAAIDMVTTKINSSV